ncbi:MAG: TetR/AcrR family transcriptional regulator [Caldilinea sp.]|nr:TetR/AcrR family transcriptional regulator [Caldilineaceae bacterium]MCB9117484.1 TetR/AcrR family transcriptional regulator [Caldilineaceae bacterium]MCB9118102.1 TetR/AcrR family transcriptional regulator [Caldilineaceae bacterium]MCB9123273.1 TetR/AcrR family transcriptional regulator [Caldilineaceae bacterium]MCO5212116.1 TetR/AcrR family transcriptional regulator [Caldilinea sp.]
MSDKKQQLLEASIDLFAREGFWNTSTASIAKHAGVATGTLFNYFPSKDALIDAVYMHLKHEWLQHIQRDYPVRADIKSRLEHIWYRNIDWGVRFPERYNLKQQLSLSGVLGAEAVDYEAEELAFLHELIQEGFNQGIFKEMSVDYFNSMVMAEMDATVRYATAQGLKDMALARLIALSSDVLWSGVAR